MGEKVLDGFVASHHLCIISLGFEKDALIPRVGENVTLKHKRRSISGRCLSWNRTESGYGMATIQIGEGEFKRLFPDA